MPVYVNVGNYNFGTYSGGIRLSLIIIGVYAFGLRCCYVVSGLVNLGVLIVTFVSCIVVWYCW